jgi:hypothetical protein
VFPRARHSLAKIMIGEMEISVARVTNDSHGKEEKEGAGKKAKSGLSEPTHLFLEPVRPYSSQASRAEIMNPAFTLVLHLRLLSDNKRNSLERDPR